MAVREEILNALGIENINTGLTEYQIATMTEKINNLNSHLVKNHKDNAGKRGLMVLVGKRNRLISYLKGKSLTRYKNLIEKLGLRK